jgi:hypothetical protein
MVFIIDSLLPSASTQAVNLPERIIVGRMKMATGVLKVVINHLEDEQQRQSWMVWVWHEKPAILLIPSSSWLHIASNADE